MRFWADAGIPSSVTLDIQVGSGGTPGIWSTGTSATDGADTTISWSGNAQVTAKGGRGGDNFNMTNSGNGIGGTGGAGGAGFPGGNGGPNANFGPVQGGAGDAGNQTSISGSAVYFGGGGGGGICAPSPSYPNITARAGGNGGGGNGAVHTQNVGDTAGSPGQVNTGGGGGGGASCNGANETFNPSNNGVTRLTNGGNGGSGIVVVAYTLPPPTTTTIAATTTVVASTVPATTTTLGSAAAAPQTSNLVPAPVAQTTSTTSPTRAPGASGGPAAGNNEGQVAAAAQSTTSTTTEPRGLTPAGGLTTTTTSPSGLQQASVIPPTMDLVAFSASSPRLMRMSTDLQPGATTDGARFTLSPRGLLADSTVTVLLQPGDIVLGTQQINSTGAGEFAVVLPDGITAGLHSVVMTGTSDSSGPISSIIHIETDDSGLVTSILPAYETVGDVPSQSAIRRAIEAGATPYDVVREVPTTAVITTTAVVLMGLIGAAGAGLPHSAPSPQSSGTVRSRRPSRGNEPRAIRDASGDDTMSGPPTERQDTIDQVGRDQQSEGTFASTDANVLGTSASSDEQWGDRLRTWVTFGYAHMDSLLRRAVRHTSTRSVLVTRLLQDGTWMRAVAGSGEIVVWAASLALGASAAVSTGFLAVAPSVKFVAVIAALSLVNGLAGALAWISFVSAVALDGNITNIFDVRTLIGLSFVFFALPTIASAIRPLRDDGSRPQIHRVGDYVMMPVFLAYGAAGIYSALNGLSGLSLVTPEDATLLRNVVFVAAVVRLAIEDIVRHGFPARMTAVSMEITAEPGLAAQITKWLTATCLYAMAMMTFYGWGVRTAVMLALVSFVPVLKMFSSAFPNLVAVHRWFPRGILRTVIMIFVGTWYGRFVLSLADDPVDTRRIAVFLLLPGILLGVVDCLAREGGEWEDRPAKHVAGFALWLVSLSVLVGVISV